MTAIIVPAVQEKKAKPINGDTVLVYLIDRSGSMSTCWEETIGGLNADITRQKTEDDGKTEAIVAFFDGSSYSKQTNLIIPCEGSLSQAIVFSQVDPHYAPNGATPLYDAVGKLIEHVAARVDATPGEMKPNVLFSIYTDGGNNCSHGHTPDQVKKMVEGCEERGWSFTYFGANQDAWEVGGSFGIKAGNAMTYGTHNMEAVMMAASAARSSHTRMAKRAFHEGAAYNTSNYFTEAGQSEDDYKD